MFVKLILDPRDFATHVMWDGPDRTVIFVTQTLDPLDNATSVIWGSQDKLAAVVERNSSMAITLKTMIISL